MTVIKINKLFNHLIWSLFFHDVKVKKAFVETCEPAERHYTMLNIVLKMNKIHFNLEDVGRGRVPTLTLFSTILLSEC